MAVERYTNAYSRTSGETLQFSDQETPSGTIDGANLTFTLLWKPVASTLRVYLNGVFLKPTTDWTISGKTLTIDAGSAPLPGDQFIVYYRF